ncbi:hypothetical protein ACI2KT_18930 [Ensifer adhaerens]|uniref:hypothetical protein n=1 Tax=Sinorhizobium phage phiLM21 TaxID=1524882 RepID=UPI0004E5E20E|nr:hypothetical protein [Ensifer sp. Root558]YP_009221524.1 hypothetical protein AWJ26_gp55 [Sinorhizobium phage phiLM21]AII27805.1 hypothetical protein phiLM21_p054 [Sinorhizobium phage phiLM21]KQZ41849.1 hypothetical protein ASD63_16765 [Ensifer sp. Root558]OWZ93569.1 hypothetical protein B9J07_13090 [Sinorhizobium sp. LM21]
MADAEFVDLSGLEALVQSQEAGIEIIVVNEKGEPIGLKIGVVGPDSERMQKAMRDVAAEFAKAAAERENLGEAPADEADARLIAILAKATTHWSPDPKIGGRVVPFSEENVRNLYTRFKIIRDQVEAKAARRSSFTKG